MFTWELNLTELKSNRDLIQDKDSSSLAKMLLSLPPAPSLPFTARSQWMLSTS